MHHHSGSGACTIASAWASPSGTTTHSVCVLKGQILVEKVVVGVRRGRARLPAHAHSHTAVSEVLLEGVRLCRVEGHCRGEREGGRAS